jgi:hypothetical protein
MRALIASLPNFIMLGQNPIQSTPMAIVNPFIQESCLDLAWRFIAKTLTIENRSYRFSLFITQGARRRWMRSGVCNWLLLTIPTATRYPDQVTSGSNTKGLT